MYFNLVTHVAMLAFLLATPVFLQRLLTDLSHQTSLLLV